jgi:monofunctional biosynthetic peptidoglycan transglycosylase
MRSRGRNYDFGGRQCVILRVKGDGRTYRFRISTDARHRGGRIAYGADFRTKAGEWIEVKIPFKDLTPTHHGDALDGPPLNLSNVEEIGFQIGDKRPGPFAITIDWMKVE